MGSRSPRHEPALMWDPGTYHVIALATKLPDQIRTFIFVRCYSGELEIKQKKTRKEKKRKEKKRQEKKRKEKSRKEKRREEK